MKSKRSNKSVEPTGARHSAYGVTGSLAFFLFVDCHSLAPVAHFYRWAEVLSGVALDRAEASEREITVKRIRTQAEGRRLYVGIAGGLAELVGEAVIVGTLRCLGR